MHPTRVLLAVAALASACSGEAGGPAAAPERPPAPVAAAPIERRAITLRRTFSGTLEAAAEVAIAPRITGLVERLHVDIGDEIAEGDLVAVLDDDELRQAVRQAEAELAVARANDEEAGAANEIAQRALGRAEALHSDGVTSQGELDRARTSALAARSRTSVTRAQIERAEASLAAARLRLSQTRIVARWSDETELEPGSTDAPPVGPSAPAPRTRLVSRRLVDEGALVAPGQALVNVVEVEPVVAVVFVPERDYRGLAVGQVADVRTDAYPTRTFRGTVSAISPVFSSASRQVRVELTVPNPGRVLKPGMFARATLELDGREAATVVPYAALTRRRDEAGVFLVDAVSVARWRPITQGIREGRWVEVVGLDGADTSLEVVTIGQELVDDGSPVSVLDGPGEQPAPEGGAPR
ncbi:MAG: efflux RND transporter periplasmic adaptor subunit [Planctomycetota bacterium]